MTVSGAQTVTFAPQADPGCWASVRGAACNAATATGHSLCPEHLDELREGERL